MSSDSPSQSTSEFSEDSADQSPSEPAASVSRPVRRSLLWVTLFVAALVLVTDQISKIVVVATLAGRPPVQILGEVLQLNLVRNPGAAFSLGTGFTIIFSLIALAVVVVVVRTARSLASIGWAIALGGLLGGALGNLVDRLLRDPGPLRGHVIDFLQLPYWPVFNVADMAIVGSAGLMVILTLRGVGLRGVDPGAGVGGE